MEAINLGDGGSETSGSALRDELISFTSGQSNSLPFATFTAAINHADHHIAALGWYAWATRRNAIDSSPLNAQEPAFLAWALNWVEYATVGELPVDPPAVGLYWVSVLIELERTGSSQSLGIIDAALNSFSERFKNANSEQKQRMKDCLLTPLYDHPSFREFCHEMFVVGGFPW